MLKGMLHLQESWVLEGGTWVLATWKVPELRAAGLQLWMVWNGVALEMHAGQWLGHTQYPNFFHSLIFCITSVPLCLVLLGLSFVSKPRAQRKAFSDLRAPGVVLGKAAFLTHHN